MQQWAPPMQMQQWSPPMQQWSAPGKGCGGCCGAKGAGKAMNWNTTGSTTGTVKSFSDKNGYGFITIPGRQDIKFGKMDLVGVESVTAGARVTFQTVNAPDGRQQAKQVQVSGGGGGNAFPNFGVKRPFEPSYNGKGDGNMGSFGGAMMQQKRPRPSPGPTEWQGQGAGGEAMGEEKWVSGTVKSFNAKKGFGFLVSEEIQGDAFFMATALPPEMQGNTDGNALMGRSASFKLAYAPDGKLRAENITIM